MTHPSSPCIGAKALCLLYVWLLGSSRPSSRRKGYGEQVGLARACCCRHLVVWLVWPAKDSRWKLQGASAAEARPRPARAERGRTGGS